MAWTDSQILSSIAYYYGTNSSLWDKIKTNNATFEEIQSAYNAIPTVSTVQSINGTTLGIDVSTRFAEPPSIVTEIVSSADSNYSNPSYGNDGALTGNIPANFGGGGGSDYTVNAGAISGAGSSAQKVYAVADKLSLAVTAVNSGAKLGMKIDEALYNLNPDWWDEHFPTINPQTWTSIAGEDENGKKFIRSLFGIKDDKLIPYVTDDVIAYVYQLFRDSGAFNTGISESTLDDYTPLYYKTYPKPFQFIVGTYGHQYQQRPYVKQYTFDTSVNLFWAENTTYLCAVSNVPFNITYTVININTGIIDSQTTYSCRTITKNNITYYYDFEGTGRTYVNDANFSPNVSDIIPSISLSSRDNIGWDISYIIYNGDISGGTAIDGISTISDATVPDPSIIDGTDIPTIKQQLKDNYPQLFTDPITSTVMQPDGTLRTDDYYPIPWATDGPTTEPQPTTKTETQTITEIKPETFPQIFPETQTTLDDPPITPPPAIGDGNTPDVVVPTVEPTTLWAIYNPTHSQVNSFGAWLWSTNFVDQILKLFANPMQAIISLHKIYCTPDTGNAQNIIVFR